MTDEKIEKKIDDSVVYVIRILNDIARGLSLQDRPIAQFDMEDGSRIIWMNKKTTATHDAALEKKLAKKKKIITKK